MEKTMEKIVALAKNRGFVNPENKELLKALPPCFLVSSRGDNLRKYTLNFYKALKQVNTKSELLYFKKDKKRKV